MKYTKKILMISMAAVLGVAMITPTVSAEWSFLDVAKAKISVIDRFTLHEDGFVKVGLSTKAPIPTDGSGGAFGYGMMTSDRQDSILVTTTHAGVLDSESQTDSSDASFHAHYVSVQNSESGSGLCEGLEIVNITYEDPAREIDVYDNKVRIMKVPFQFDGTDSLTGEEISFLSNSIVQSVVSFTIQPILDEDNEIVVVCLNDLLFLDSDRVVVDFK